MSKRTGGRLVRPDRVKYPRTYHLPWSSGQTSDDRVLENTAHFAGRRVIVTEKMDGENTTMYRDYIHARSLDSRNHPSRDWVKNLHARIRNGIPLGLRVCGENLFARHTLSYSGLPSFFMVFSIWDENNLCLSWDETVDFAAALGLVTVPLIYDGPWDEQYARNLSASMDLSVQEGFVVRLAESFSYGAFRSSIAKFVRKEHAGAAHNWMRQRVERNG